MIKTQVQHRPYVFFAVVYFALSACPMAAVLWYENEFGGGNHSVLFATNFERLAFRYFGHVGSIFDPMLPAIPLALLGIIAFVRSDRVWGAGLMLLAALLTYIALHFGLMLVD